MVMLLDLFDLGARLHGRQILAALARKRMFVGQGLGNVLGSHLLGTI